MKEYDIKLKLVQSSEAAMMSELKKATEIEITAKRILKLKHDINKMIAEKTGQPIERVAHDTERDYFMTAEEAKAYGIVDDVVTKK